MTTSDQDALLALALGKDVAAATQATRELARKAPLPTMVHAILNAAINLDDNRFLNAAAVLAVTASLPINDRIQASWRLAIAGFGERALAVLLCDPRMFTDAAAIDRAFKILGIVQARGAPGSLAREQATALSRRLVPVERMAATPSEHGFGGSADATPQILGPPLMLHAAPGVPPVILEQVIAVTEEFDESVSHMRHPSVRVLKDVFVNRLGQIWGRNGKAHRHFNRMIPAESRQAEATAPVVEEAVLGVETHNNVYHWFAECFLSLAWRLDDAASTIPILIRENAARFVTESLAMAATGPVPTVAAGDAVLVRRLHMAEAHLGTLARPEAVGPMLQRLRDRALAADADHAGAGQPLYISRRDSKNRPMNNEAALEEALVARGFQAVTMTGRPLTEQIALVSGASCIVSAHGAGLALLATAAPGRRVLEFVPALRGGMALRTCMAKISRIVGHEHHIWLQDTPAAGGTWSLALDPVLTLVDTLRQDLAS